MKEKTKLKLSVSVSLIVLVIIIYIFFFVLLPAHEAMRLEEFKDNQEMKRGVIILVVPNDAVYFKDGSIMKHWQREDYDEFRNHIGMEVTITYGELKEFDYPAYERMLFKIVETPIGGR